MRSLTPDDDLQVRVTELRTRVARGGPASLAPTDLAVLSLYRFVRDLRALDADDHAYVLGVMAGRLARSGRAGLAGPRGAVSDGHPSCDVRGAAGAEDADGGIELEDGRRLPRIPYFPLPWEPLEAPCGSCGVAPGSLHCWGCARELCPSCGARLGAVAAPPER